MTYFDSDLIIFHYDPIKSLKILSKQVLPLESRDKLNDRHYNLDFINNVAAKYNSPSGLRRCRFRFSIGEV